VPNENDRYTIHVVSHTHWDREWRHPFQASRALLVEMFDRLIELLDSTFGFRCFLLDSQCIVLEDYLAIKPEKEPELRRLVKEGRIHIGPWYTLPDTPELGGESIVRNLLMGMSITRQWEGQKWSGYCPCSFGQSSQMPQIFLGFNLDHIFFYRGNNDRVTRSEFIWEGPDGSRIMGMRSVNPYGRANWFVHVYRPVALNRWPMQWEYRWEEGRLPFRPCTEEDAASDYRLLEGGHRGRLYPENLPEALEAIKRDAVKGATCRHLLYMDGMDQTSPCPHTPEIVELANRLRTGDTYLHGSFYDYVQAVKEDARNLEVRRGEFRYPMVEGLWQNLYPGMLSARIYLKQQNRRCEAGLQKNADTWAALAALLGMEFSEGLLKLAWRYLLANQAHDSIAGCSVDLVHEDVEYRNRQVLHLADAVGGRAMAHIVKSINNTHLPEGSICLVVFNPTQFPRSEVVVAAVDLPEKTPTAGLAAEDEAGRAIPVQVFHSHRCTPLVSDPYDFPVLFRSRRFHCAMQVPEVPGVGYRTFILKPGAGPGRNRGTLSPQVNTLENDFLRVDIQNDGRLNLVSKKTGITYRGLHYFEDRSEVGDHGTSRHADWDETITTIGRPASVTKVLDGELAARYRIDTTLPLPRNALPDGSRRNPEKVAFPIVSHVTLKKDSPVLEVRTEIDNRVYDHRLRVLFPSGYQEADQSYSETHFAVTRRDVHLPDTSSWAEPMLPFHPQYMFCGIEDGKSGLALFNIGLPEYSVAEDPERTVGLTLLRTYRYPIIGANPEDTTTDESQVMCQCLRPFTFDYAMYPYAGDWQEGQVFQYAYRFNLPLRVNQTGRSSGGLPPSMAFVHIEPERLVLSAVKRSSRSRGLIIRLFNPTQKTIEGRITLFRPIRRANQVNLDEQVIGPADHRGDSIFLAVSGSRIVTLDVLLDPDRE
jgi:alpha-mannosidase